MTACTDGNGRPGTSVPPGPGGMRRNRPAGFRSALARLATISPHAGKGWERRPACALQAQATARDKPQVRHRLGRVLGNRPGCAEPGPHPACS
jgi:hypothetical protein